jgi:glycosyltransferase involved in cell wall biosynthesis
MLLALDNAPFQTRAVGESAPHGVALGADRVRVLFVHGTLEIGGAEEVRLSLLSCLDRGRHEATVCCLQQGGAIAREVAALGYEVIVLGHRAHALSLRTLRALRRLIQARRPHIVQTSLPRANYWGRWAATLERVPVIIAEEHAVADKADWARPIVEGVLGPRTQCVIAVSESVRDAVASMGRASARRPTVVIPNPVNEWRLKARRGRLEVRQELGLVEGEELLLHSGRMERLRGAKGQDILMAALAALPASGPRMSCAFLGDGPARPELERLAVTLGVSHQVRLLGYRRDVADFLAAADLFVFPSRVEGMPIALMEALWVGLPVVASDIPANRETLGGGRYGCLVPPSSPDALAAAIARLAGAVRERAELGSRAYSYARGAFSPRRYADSVSGLWQRLLGASSEGISWEARGTAT